MNTVQYPDPSHTLLHLSDTHLVGERRPLYGAVDCDANLESLLDRLRSAQIDLDAIVLTGDLADAGAPDAYVRLRALVEPFAAEHGCPVLWVMGNHDDRATFRAELLNEEPGSSPIDRVYEVNGLRVITLDSTVPGSHHGELSAVQLEWLDEQLETPALHGTLIALHHPPVPTTVPLLQLVELRDAAPFETVLRGTDVRGILAGHFHYSTHSTFAGIPVSVAAATCYTQDLAIPTGSTHATDSGQGANLVHVYPDRIVHSQIDVTVGPTVYALSPEDTASAIASASNGEPVFTDLLTS
ncbi:phosphodiesterase [Rhodococcus sp. 114MFTsu3.1]|uniref:phosphodiesterase n=1 Tax=Rhodococcus sp. 114MFTsu3.1 TaxID=1172184 RepID=UPI00035F83AA|nr:phosphodiesterase [Rhodococcus sp. 114MFTsu3.1]